MTPSPKSASDRHLYLFALEVTPLTVGQAYDDLPLHCTFMFRFWSELVPDVLASKTAPVFAAAPPVVLTSYKHAQLGPCQVGAYLVEKTPALMGLHLKLYDRLNMLSTDFTEPQYVGEGYKPHITDRADESIVPGQPRSCLAAYLIEVIDGRRHICARFALSKTG